MKTVKQQKCSFKPHLKLLVGLLIFCLPATGAFSQNRKFTAGLYGNYLKGLLAIEKKDYDLGLQELSKAKAKDPQSAYIRLKEAVVLIRLEKMQEAEETLREAKLIDPDNLDIYLALVFVYSYTKDDTGLEREYEEFLKKAHELKPEDIGISKYLAQFYLYKQRPQEAIRIYEKILENNPDYVEAFFWLGYFQEEAGSKDIAVKIWKEGLEKDPGYAPILNSLGYVYAQDGTNLDAAEEMIKKALEQEPRNGAYLDSLGWVYFKKGDFSNAEKYLTEAISYFKDPEIYKHLGDLYIEIDNLEKGINYYQEGLSEFPGDEDLELKIKEHEEQN